MFDGQPVYGAHTVLQQGEPTQHALPVCGVGVGGSGRGCGSALARHFWLLPLLLLLFPQQSLQKEVNNKIHQTSNITTFVSIAVRAAMLDLSSSASSQMIIIP